MDDIRHYLTEQDVTDYAKHKRNTNPNKNRTQMKTNTSKIKNIAGAGNFDTQHGMLFSFIYDFEDGQTIKANHKSENSPFKIGDEAEYTVKKTHPTYGDSGSVKKPESDGGFKPSAKPTTSFKADPLKQASIERQVALKEAINFHNVAGFENEEMDIKMTEIVRSAKYFFTFLKGQ